MDDRDLSGRTLGEFRLLEKIGEGGYGAVYRAEQALLDREVAIKVLHERRRDKVTQRRFLREARLASRLNHPYAAHVYASGVETEDGLLWIAMELVDGVTLADWLKSRGPMPLDQLVALVGDVAAVIHLAHERGIIHRDLKPSNIMVIESGDRWIPKLLDFGIAKVFNPEPVPEDVAIIESDEPESESLTDERVTVPKQSRLLTPPGAGMGSRDYMSPEQRRNAWSVGPATDIYSLGIVIYKSLTGRLPFTAERTDEYYELQCHAPVPPLGDNFSPELDRVLQRALAKRPEARHRDVLELVSELQAALRTSKREQLRSSALQWKDAGRAPGLLWPRDMLARVKQQVAQDELSGLECSFVAASQRRARRVRWLRGLLGALAIMSVFGVLLMRAHMAERQAELQTRLAQEQMRAAQELVEARVTESELEQGRAALLHSEPEALAHLAEAYKRDPSPTTAFMLARAMQPRLAEQARFPSTYGRMWWATFSPDGRQIATTDDRAAQIWDGQTHRLLFTLPHGCEVYQAVYSPDSKWLVTAAETAVKIWDAATGALVRDLKAKPDGRTPSDYYRSAISPDGRLIAAMDAAGSVAHVWDATNGALVAELHSHAGDFPRLAFSLDGWLAMTGGNEARVFDVRTWRQVVVIPGPVHSLAFDAHSRLVTGTVTGNVALWAIPSAARLRHLRQFGEGIVAVAFSPDGQLVAAGSRDGTMQVWQASSGALQSQLNPRHSTILWVEFDPTSTLLLAANADGTVVVADVAQGLPVAILDGSRNFVRVAHFDANSRVVAASWDGTARIWDAASPYRHWTSEPLADGCGIAMSSEPDGRFIAVGCGARPTRVWDTARDQLLAELPSVTTIANGGYTSAFPAVSAEGDRAAIARGNAVEVYELPGGRLVRTVEHGAPVSSVAFASSGPDLVSGAIDGSVLIRGKDGVQRALQASAGIDVAELLPDGRVIVSDAARRLRVYALDGAVLADLEMPVRMMSLRRNAGHVVALPSYTSNAAPPLVIDLDRYRVVAQLEGHLGQVFSARWVSEGRIITAGADGTARLWNSETGRLLQTYEGGSRFLADATLISDGLVVAGDADGLVRFWDAASGVRLWTLQAHKSAVIGVHVEDGDIVTRGFTGEISRWRLPRPDQVIGACARHIPCAIVPR
jgi:WD40 repeat protein/serine/threonine protein kinase